MPTVSQSDKSSSAPSTKDTVAEGHRRFVVDGKTKFYDPDGNVAIVTDDNYVFMLRDHVLKTVSQTFLDHLAATPIPEDSVLEMSLYEKAEDLYRWLTLVIDLEVNTKPLNMSDVPEGNGEAAASNLQVLEVLWALINKYQSEKHVEVLKAALVRDALPQRFDRFVFACERGWVDSARVIMKEFGAWRFIKSHGPTFLPEHIPQSEVRKLGLEAFACYVRALEGCRYGRTVDWLKASGQFSLTELVCKSESSS